MSTTGQNIRAPFAAGMLTLVLLGTVQAVVTQPMLLAERFFTGAGWVEVFALAIYAGSIAWLMADPARSPKIRQTIWTLFSFVFFTQLTLGLLGIEKMLMSGNLHLPVPALIIAAPIYRGGGIFMTILFFVTVVLVGPGWCSYLCYIGAGDDFAARHKKKPTRLPPWRNKLRVAILIAVIGAAFALNALGAPGSVPATLAAIFGIVGVGVMLFGSTKTGAMVHCTTYCPMGWLATRLGKISPFRMRISDGCTQCGRCFSACRYDALHEGVEKPQTIGASCTLCGDCVTQCKEGVIRYRFPGQSHESARTVFIVLVVALHATFLGVARM
jgi:polyferredoxin